MLQRAPKMKNEPFLYFWGKSEVDLNTGLECNHRFLGSSKADTVISTEKLSSEMYMQTTYYEAPPVEYKPCNAPLKNGKLCTRRDARFCPFHGPVIPRDENGSPISELDQSRTEDDIQIPLFGKGVETAMQDGERKKRKSEQGLRERMKEKVTPKKQSRISM